MKIAILDYPGSSKASLYGLQELFEMANRAVAELLVERRFYPQIVQWVNQADMASEFAVVIIPPSGSMQYYLDPAPSMLEWLVGQRKSGAVLASACAGAFILAQTGLLANKTCTTHWALAGLFRQRFHNIDLKPEAILINEGGILTAGGMMSWLDLGLELVSTLSSPAVMRLLGKMLVVDTGGREQRFYQQFSPNLQHGDSAVLNVQHFIADHYTQGISNLALADIACLTERTLQRRFQKATGLSLNQYIQHVRVQKACDLLESSHLPFDAIAHRAGYQDVSAFRKVFVKTMGLTPKAFRARFC
ncbi:helix-turn-helix domain-containing protein [Vibrio sp. CAU 1672]|uniref:GlxA family transcriptional regulator n=1 Tax=Vibrio sp. CAU 1672 TaxID=3032594 RepID=UPI0023DAAC05|nr:helix-turn-helix domain-containing protein [Vibrio sp. CAU 1672]MDF2152705.1 helix-turn-helix domain-containing protein [Vibrio sp. CAU 1672]